MDKFSSHLIITTLAKYQTEFWIECIKRIDFKNKITFFSFDERSSELLKKNNIQFFDIPFLSKKKNHIKNFDINNLLKKFDIHNSNLIINHEKICFSLKNSLKLELKLCRYLTTIDKIFLHLKKKKNIQFILLQEFGGFIANHSSFYVARKYGIDNYFLEPSFFKGRLFLVKNSFKSKNIKKDRYVISKDLKKYLNLIRHNKEIVIPIKDNHHYFTAIKKVLNVKNLLRLIQKNIDKFILRKYQEFGYSNLYAFKHLLMVLNSIRLKSIYSKPSKNVFYLYFPLHVPDDAALTIRSPEYFDQLSLIDLLSKAIPRNFKLYIKEHPARVGAINFTKLKNLINLNDNISLIDPLVNNFDLMSSSKGVITINSKSGAEAILLNKPVFVLGDAFYSYSSPAIYINDIKKIYDILYSEKILSHKFNHKNLQINYFNQVWHSSIEGELYYISKKNLNLINKIIFDLLKIK